MRSTVLGSLLVFMGISFNKFDFFLSEEAGMDEEFVKFLPSWQELLEEDQVHDLAASFCSLLAKEEYKDPLVLEEFHRLFQNPCDQVPLWESVWLSKEKILFTEETVAVRNTYRNFGFDIHSFGFEAEDHLGFEFAFCGYLYDLAIIDHSDEGLKALQSFFHEHIGRWGLACLGELLKKAQTEYWRVMLSVGEYLLQRLQSELSLTAISDETLSG